MHGTSHLLLMCAIPAGAWPSSEGFHPTDPDRMPQAVPSMQHQEGGKPAPKALPAPPANGKAAAFEDADVEGSDEEEEDSEEGSDDEELESDGDRSFGCWWA